MSYGHDPAAATAIILGFLFNLFLSGIVLSQCTDYYIDFKRDLRWLRNFVGFVFLLDVSDTIICAITLYLFVTEPSNMQFGRFTRISYFGTIHPPLTGLISCSVQLFNIYRIHRLRECVPLTVLLATASVSQFLTGIVSAASFRYGMAIDTGWIHVTWLGLLAAGDIMIAAAMIDYLKEQTTGYARTDDLISKIVRATVQTGVILTTWAIVHLFCFAFLMNDVHIFFAITTGKLYTTSLFSLLNARSRWNKTIDERPGPTLTSIVFNNLANQALQSIRLDPEDVHVVKAPTLLDRSDI